VRAAMEARAQAVLQAQVGRLAKAAPRAPVRQVEATSRRIAAVIVASRVRPNAGRSLGCCSAWRSSRRDECVEAGFAEAEKVPTTFE